MLPLVNLRSLLNRPGYDGVFRQEVLRLVGRHKTWQLLTSPHHDYLVIAALRGEGMVYPDLAQTSAAKAPLPLRELPRLGPPGSQLEGAATAGSGPEAPRWGDCYPFREGDFNDSITLDLFRTPVVTNTGFIMERSSFDELLKKGQPCPQTRQALTGATVVERGNAEEEYSLYNGPVRLGGEWMAIMKALHRAAGLREFHRLRGIPMYRDFKSLVQRALGRELGDEAFAEILENDFDAHISSAAPRRRMALGSELFGQGSMVIIQQFQKASPWPEPGQPDFFVVLPQSNIAYPYCMPMEGLDERGLPFPPNYYRSESTPDRARS